MDWRSCGDCRRYAVMHGRLSQTCVGYLLISAAVIGGRGQSAHAQTYPLLAEFPTPAFPIAPAPNGQLTTESPVFAIDPPGKNDVFHDTFALPGESLNSFDAHAPQNSQPGLPPGGSAGMLPPPAGNSMERRSLNDVIRDTAAARRRTREQFQTPATHHSPGDEADESGHPFGQLRDRISQSRSEMATTYGRLNEKLNRLESLLKNSPACGPQPPATGRQPSPDEPRNTSIEPLPQASDRYQATLKSPARTVNPAPQATSEKTRVTTQPIVDAITVTNEPVDQLSLANNLYATQEYEIALQIYQKIDLGGLSNRDGAWVRYQIANCQRQLGQEAAAERGFRQLTGAADGGWWSRQAHWWLDASDKTTRLQQRLDQLQLTLNALRGESHDGTRPK